MAYLSLPASRFLGLAQTGEIKRIANVTATYKISKTCTWLVTQPDLTSYRINYEVGRRLEKYGYIRQSSGKAKLDCAYELTPTGKRYNQ